MLYTSTFNTESSQICNYKGSLTKLLVLWEVARARPRLDQELEKSSHVQNDCGQRV